MTDLWDGEIAGARIRRKVPRFRVKPSLPISISIQQKKAKTFSAATLSRRGLGFFGNAEDGDLLAFKNVDLKVQMDKYCFDIKGIVRYCSLIQKPDGSSHFVGIQFMGINPLLSSFLERFIAEHFKKGHLSPN